VGRASIAIHWVIWPTIIISLFGLTGCWDAIEMNDLSIGIAAALDVGPGDKVRFSEQIVVPGPLGSLPGGGGGGGGGGGQSAKPYYTVSALGLNVKDAMQNIQMKLPRRLFVAHRRIILVSEAFARKGIRRSLDEFARNPESRLRTKVVLTKGEALDFLKVPYPFEREPTDGLRQIVFGVASNIKLDLKDLMYMLSTPGSQAFLPTVELRTPSVPGSQARYEATGIGILRDGKLVGEMTGDEMKGVLWLRKEMRRGTASVSLPGHKGNVSCQLLRVRSDFEVEMRQGSPAMKIKLHPEAEIAENGTDLDLSKPKNVELVEQAYSRKVEAMIKQSLNTLQHRYDADVVMFNEHLFRAFPDQLPLIEKHWEDAFAHMPVTVEVFGRIRRIGMTRASLTRRENEVKR